MKIDDAWAWYDALGRIRPKRPLKTERASAKYRFFGDWAATLVDHITDGRPLLVNFHVAGTFHIGDQTKPGAIIQNCLFMGTKKRRLRAAIGIDVR